MLCYNATEPVRPSYLRHQALILATMSDFPKEVSRKAWQIRAVRAEERLEALESKSEADKMSISTLQENNQALQKDKQALQAQVQALQAQVKALQKLRLRHNPMK